MKKKRLILVSIFIFLVSTPRSSFAPPYSVVCIDPGHGGPGASKYGPNGDGHGTCGPVLPLSEQWVNLQVGLELKDLIYYMGGVGYPVIMTRWTQEAENLPTNYDQAMWRRANIANYSDDGSGTQVTQLISIHHNGYTPTPGSQGTEVWWSSQVYTDSGYIRNRGYWRPAYQDSLLARKIQLRLLHAWNYRDRCITRCGSGSGSSFCCDETRFERKFVLYNTVMPSALSEASNLKDTTEEILFNDSYWGHVHDEAVALFEGWYSHADNAGIGIVRNSYASGGGGQVMVSDDWDCDDCDTLSSPYTACWLFGETHCLKAITPQAIGIYEYVFHHWTHLNTWGGQVGEDWYDPEWLITVPAEFEYHRYVAYFTGGPYSAQVVSPDGNQIWQAGEERIIEWNVSPGADSTTWVDVFIDRNGGNDGYPERIVDSIMGAYYWGWNWTVTPPYSTHCKIKVVAYDRAGNYAEDVSNQDFIISDSGNNDPQIDSHIYCRYPTEDCGDCVHCGESVTIQVDASDPDGDSLFYDWYAFLGHFAENGQHTVTTAQNYATYVAPAKGEKGEKIPFEDFISVAVTDVRGGQTYTVGQPDLQEESYSCLCGDANDDGVVNLGDALTILNYLFKGQDPPVDPILRGDANNDCDLQMGDALRIMNWLFKGQEPPECCWFPTEESGK
jgi:N-acetylmuramoyl-L-alanine amidase